MVQSIFWYNKENTKQLSLSLDFVNIKATEFERSNYLFMPSGKYTFAKGKQ